MNDGDGETGGDVTVSMEITGEYGDVVAKLRMDESTPALVEPLRHDIDVLLETVERIGGGTRRVIAAELPSDTSVPYDPQAVVETLQVLERYDLVVLDGNTWKPGPDSGDTPGSATDPRHPTDPASDGPRRSPPTRTVPRRPASADCSRPRRSSRIKV